jgi:ATP-dependent protease Clp ATPase subunit
MNDAISCSFCGKPNGKVLDLILARKGPSTACICDECVEVCGKILKKSGTEPIVARPTTYRISSQAPAPGLLSCSFCGASQEIVHRLIASSPRLATAHICDKCVDLCFAAIAREDADRAKANTAPVRNWVARKAGVHSTTIHHIG